MARIYRPIANTFIINTLKQFPLIRAKGTSVHWHPHDYWSIWKFLLKLVTLPFTGFSKIYKFSAFWQNMQASLLSPPAFNVNYKTQKTLPGISPDGAFRITNRLNSKSFFFPHDYRTVRIRSVILIAFLRHLEAAAGQLTDFIEITLIILG